MDEPKVTKLTPIYNVPGTPNETVIEMLETMLERAKAGEVQAIALATVEHDDATGTSFCYENHFARLIGAVAMLQHRIIIDGEGL